MAFTLDKWHCNPRGAERQRESHGHWLPPGAFWTLPVPPGLWSWALFSWMASRPKQGIVVWLSRRGRGWCSRGVRAGRGAEGAAQQSSRNRHRVPGSSGGLSRGPVGRPRGGGRQNSRSEPAVLGSRGWDQRNGERARRTSRAVSDTRGRPRLSCEVPCRQGHCAPPLPSWRTNLKAPGMSARNLGQNKLGANRVPTADPTATQCPAHSENDHIPE